MKRNELVTTLFIQAWWNYIVGDVDSSEEIISQAICMLYTGFPFDVVVPSYKH